MSNMSKHILQVANLSVAFKQKETYHRAVEDISFHLDAGETLALVGESGCGKSVSSLAIMGLIQEPGRIDGGEVVFEGNPLNLNNEEDMRRVRGNRISMIFQEPMTSLNPVFTVGFQVDEVFRTHKKYSRKVARQHTIAMLDEVKIPDPERCAKSYPFQLSGGMRQRVMIAMALACEPDILIADEPTTALDVTVQAQVLDLISSLKAQRSTAVLLITHDLGVVNEFSDRVAVMYAGKIVETANKDDFFADPRHPYSKLLIASVPKIGQRLEKLPTIEGMVPPLAERGSGCRFKNRCPRVLDACQTQVPNLTELAQNHAAACMNPEGAHP